MYHLGWMGEDGQSYTARTRGGERSLRRIARRILATGGPDVVEIRDEPGFLRGWLHSDGDYRWM